MDNGLLDRDDELEVKSLRELKDVREAIRELLLANNGLGIDRERAARTLDDAAVGVGLAVRFRPDGNAAFEGGADAPVARVLAAVAALSRTDSWSRLKACRSDDCRWAFVDDSRNRSRAWCSMAVCGNRAKARAYRRRH